MTELAGLDQRRDRTSWAAYVLGHDAGFLRAWMASTWDHRRAAATGQLAVPDHVPSEADELVEAIKLLSCAESINAGQAAGLAGAAHELRRAVEDLLAQLHLSSPEEGDFDWESDATPGLTEWVTLRREMEGAFEKDSVPDRWRLAGELLADLRPDWVFPDEGRQQVLGLIRHLNETADYPFLPDVWNVLQGDARAEPGSPAAQLLDPLSGLPDVARVEGYVRHGLRHGVGPEPWVHLTQDGVTFLGSHWRAGDFGPARLGIMWLLCERPRRDVGLQYIKDACNLACDLRNLKTNVSRLRSRLRPAVDERFKGATRPEFADQCFIVGARGNPTAYSLEIESPLVAVVPPRPDYMDPPDKLRRAAPIGRDRYGS